MSLIVVADMTMQAMPQCLLATAGRHNNNDMRRRQVEIEALAHAWSLTHHHHGSLAWSPTHHHHGSVQ
jgi:hypothetical protein